MYFQYIIRDWQTEILHEHYLPVRPSNLKYVETQIEKQQ